MKKTPKKMDVFSSGSPCPTQTNKELIQTALYTAKQKFVQTTFAVPEDKMRIRILFFDRCNLKASLFLPPAALRLFAYRLRNAQSVGYK